MPPLTDTELIETARVAHTPFKNAVPTFEVPQAAAAVNGAAAEEEVDVVAAEVLGSDAADEEEEEVGLVYTLLNRYFVTKEMSSVKQMSVYICSSFYINDATRLPRLCYVLLNCAPPLVSNFTSIGIFDPHEETTGRTQESRKMYI